MDNLIPMILTISTSDTLDKMVYTRMFDILVNPRLNPSLFREATKDFIWLAEMLFTQSTEQLNSFVEIFYLNLWMYGWMDGFTDAV